MRFLSTIRLARIFSNGHFVCFKSASAALSSGSSDEEASDVDSSDQFARLDSSTVVQLLNNLRKQPSSALRCFAQLKELGFKHDAATYVAIIRILCHWDWNGRLDSIFLEVIESKKEHLGFGVTDLFDALVQGLNVEGSKLLPRALEAMVKAYISVGMFNEAIEALFQTRRCGVTVSLWLCNYLMNSLVRCGKLNMSLAIYNHLKGLGLTPDVYTYGIVIKAVCRKGSLKEAYRVFDKMKEAGVAPDNFIYTCLIEGCCLLGDSIEGCKQLHARRGAGVPMDVYAYTIVLRGFIREKKLKEAEDLLLDMNEHGPKPDADFYGALIHGFCQVGDIIKSLAYLSEMKAENIKINCVIASSILKCLHQKSMFEEAIVLFKDFQELGIYLDNVVYNDVLNAYCKLGKTEVALRLLKEMNGKGIDPDLKNYTIVIDGCFRHGRVSDAVELIEEMHQRGLKLDAAAYNVIAGGFSRNGLVEEALDYPEKLKKQNIKPSDSTFCMIIKGLLISGNAARARELFDSLEDECKEKCAGTIIDCFCESNNVIGAYDLFIRFSKQGYQIRRSSVLNLLNKLIREGDDLRSFDVALSSVDGPCMKMSAKVIAALCFSDMKKALWAFESLIDRGITPNVIIYTIMLQGYCRIHDLGMVFTLFQKMKGDGITPDIITYTVLLDGLSKCKQDLLSHYIKLSKKEQDELSQYELSKYKRDLLSKYNYIKEKIDVILGEMKDSGISADVIYYTALIDSNCKSNNLQNAVGLFRRMIVMGLAPDIVTYTALLDGCWRECEVDSGAALTTAATLVDDMVSMGMDIEDSIMSKIDKIISKAKRECDAETKEDVTLKQQPI